MPREHVVSEVRQEPQQSPLGKIVGIMVVIAFIVLIVLWYFSLPHVQFPTRQAATYVFGTMMINSSQISTAPLNFDGKLSLTGARSAFAENYSSTIASKDNISVNVFEVQFDNETDANIAYIDGILQYLANNKSDTYPAGMNATESSYHSANYTIMNYSVKKTQNYLVVGMKGQIVFYFTQSGSTYANAYYFANAVIDAI